MTKAVFGEVLPPTLTWDGFKSKAQKGDQNNPVKMYHEWYM